MILSGDSKLADTLIAALAAKPDQSAAELRRSTAREGNRYSVAAIYKEIGKLKTRGVLVKQKDRFSLSFAWLFELQQFVDKVVSRYRDGDYLKTFLPGAVGRQTWRFNNLMSMDDFWNQLFLALVAQHEGSEVYSWVPHPWFVLIHADKERTLHSALRTQRKRFFTIFGDDGYLDRLAEKLYQRSMHTYSFAPGPFLKQQSTYFDVIGEYVLTVHIEDGLTRKIEALFSSVTNRRELDPLRAMQILAARARIRMTLERNARKAGDLTRRFKEYFGG